jgi:hypothetical protein
MTRDQLREQINTMEALDGVLAAISDVSAVEFHPGETIELALSDREKAPIAYAHAVPPDVALAGLRAMQRELEQMLSKVPA